MIIAVSSLSSVSSVWSVSSVAGELLAAGRRALLSYLDRDRRECEEDGERVGSLGDQRDRLDGVCVPASPVRASVTKSAHVAISPKPSAAAFARAATVRGEPKHSVGTTIRSATRRARASTLRRRHLGNARGHQGPEAETRRSRLRVPGAAPLRRPAQLPSWKAAARC